MNPPDITTAFVCVLRSGGDYKPGHVIALGRQIKKHTTVPYRFICYTDIPPGVDLEGAEIVPLIDNYPGWWSCVEIWRTVGPVVAMGLDTMILGNIDDLINYAQSMRPDEFGLLKSWFKQGGYINGIQVWNGDWSWLYDQFDYDKALKEFRGDENYLLDALTKIDFPVKAIQADVPGIRNCKGWKRGRDTRILVFYGPFKPWKSGYLWRKEMKRVAV